MRTLTSGARQCPQGVVVALIASAMMLVPLVCLAQPPNDDITNPTIVSPFPYTNSVSTVDATTATEDPNCAGNGHTVWYVFTPTEDIRVRATTFGSSYDTTLSAYTGSLGSLTQIACNDDAGGGLQSRIDFDALAGITYYFMAGSCCGTYPDVGPGGSLVFNLGEAPPPPVLPTVQISKSGSFDRTNRTATISGTTNCQQPTYLQQSISVRQGSGRLIAQGFSYTEGECLGATPWSITAEPASGVGFAGGPVKVHMEGSAYTLPDFDFIGNFQQDARVTLRQGR